MAGTPGPVRAEVHALLSDLLPTVLPDARLDTEEGAVLIPLGPGERARVPTDSLVEGCAGEPRETWQAHTAGWLREAAAAVEAAVQAPEPDAGFGGRLRLRVVPKGAPDDLLTVPFGEYFEAMVVLDGPGGPEPLTVALAAQAGPVDDLFQAAVANTVERELFTADVRDHAVPPAESVRLVAADGSPYISSALMAVDRFLPGDAPYGALVSVPRYSMMLLHPVASRAVLDFVALFGEMTRAMHRDAADPCDPHVYWRSEGELHRVEIDDTGDPLRPRVNLDEGLRGLVDALPPSRA